MPRASAGPFSNSELVHGTVNGLNGYVLPNTELQPVSATSPMLWARWPGSVAAMTMRTVVPSPQPEHEPAPPTKPKAFSPSMMSARAFSLRYSIGVVGRDLKNETSRRWRSSVHSPLGSLSIFSSMTRAVWPCARQTSTHSAQPLQWYESMKMPKSADSMPRLAGTSPYLVVWTKCDFAVSAASFGSGWVAANASIAVASEDFGCAVARMALSGQALTQAMQPTHWSATNLGIIGDRALKSRMPAVAGPIRLRATPASAGSSKSATPRR